MPRGSSRKPSSPGAARSTSGGVRRRGRARTAGGPGNRQRRDVLDDPAVGVDDAQAQRLGEQLVFELSGHGAQRRLVERLLAAQVEKEAGVLAVEQHVGPVEEDVRGRVQDVARVEIDVEREASASTSRRRAFRSAIASLDPSNPQSRAAHTRRAPQQGTAASRTARAAIVLRTGGMLQEENAAGSGSVCIPASTSSARTVERHP